MASPPISARPKVKLAIFILFKPRICPSSPIIPGTSSLVVYSIFLPTSASKLIPFICINRGLPSLNTVPPIERSFVLVTAVTFIYPSNAPDLSWFVVEICTPRSFAITGAETIFTSGFTFFIIPAITEQFKASKFIFETVPSYKIFMASNGSSVICPMKLPRCPARLTQGRIILASSAVMEGIFNAFSTAPSFR